MAQRHVRRTPVLVEEILERVANGELYSQVWKTDPERYPSPFVWKGWCDRDLGMSEAYRRAQECGAEVMAMEAIELVDAQPAYVRELDAEGNYTKPGARLDAASVAWQRARAELRLKYVPFYNKRFTPRTVAEIGNLDGKPFVVENHAEITAKLALALRAKVRGEDPPTMIDVTPSAEDFI